MHAEFGQFGVYDVHLSPASGDNVTCELITAKEPVDIYMPLVAVTCFFMLLAAIWILCNWLYKNGYYPRFLQRRPNVTAEDVERSIEVVKDVKNKQRLKSLDTFRGISIVIMMFVNDGAGGYWFLEHSTWNGLLIADLVFPWFMWIMGVCIPISLRSSFRRKETKMFIFLNILRRSCILFVLGLVNNTVGGHIALETLRIPGVLQRFAITYFVVAVIGMLCSDQDQRAPQGSTKWRIMFQDVLVLWPQWIIMAFIVTAHCLITFLLPVNNCPTGYLGPGGLHLSSSFPGECIGGAAGYIDRLILTTDHIYNHPTAKYIYLSGPFDPEGILGSMLSVFQVFLGVQAGTTLILFQDWKSRVGRWLVWSALLGAIGAILCKASQEEGWIPVNKNLWSLSFVMVTSCFAFFLLSACLFLIDVKKWWNGAPFFYPGMNGILMYMGHQIASQLFPWHWTIGSMNSHFAKLVESVWGVSLWVLIATWLYHKKFFLAL